MSDSLISYYDPARQAVVIARESGTEVALMGSAEAESFGQEVLAASKGESTGYEEFLAQQDTRDP